MGQEIYLLIYNLFITLIYNEYIAHTLNFQRVTSPSFYTINYMKARKAKRILIVDDDPDYIFLMEEAIKTCQPSCQVEVVTQPADLMSYLEKRERPNLIFLDINMPVSNGFEVLNVIKSSDQYKQIPVVMLSVSQAKEDVFKSYDIGANAYLIKPGAFEELKRRVAVFTDYWFNMVHTPDPSWSGPDWFAELNNDN